MFLLTVLDGTSRVRTHRVDGPVCIELPAAPSPHTASRWIATPEPDGAAVTLRAPDLTPLATLRPGERGSLDDVLVHLVRAPALDTDAIVPARRGRPLALVIEGRRPVPLGDRPLTLGSSLACDVVLDDPSVSPRHCEVTARHGRHAVWDLHSANGLWIANARVPCAELDAGSAFTVGRTRVEVAALDAPRVARSIVGSSSAIARVRREIERVAPAPYAVLIEGESGAGKELVAREIHAASTRAEGPLVTVNCGAIAPELIESELFGHEKGAFTGAGGRRRGLFEEAHGGTLFLDEIGELPLALQPKLLRVLETRELRRVGGDGAVKVDVRVVSATLRDLDARVADGSFRHDLFFRLQDFRVRVPPLRERPEDVPDLAEALLDRIARDTGRHRRLEDRALARLMGWHWPGNVRELFAVLKRAVFASPGPFLAAEHLQLPGAGRPTPSSVRECAPPAWPEAVRYGDLAGLVDWCNGNLTRVSRITGLARSTIRARLARARRESSPGGLRASA
ncbi:MAG: sigma 54-interacting transcriptional regulator [Polyangiales bacterium]